MRIKKEGEARCELVDIQAGLDGCLHIGHPIGQSERELLDRGRSGLADVIPGNGDRVPAGHVAGSENDRIHHEPHRGFGGEDVLLLRDVFLQDVVLQRAAQRSGSQAFLLAHGDVHRIEDGGRRVDRHGGGDLVQPNPAEERFHVLQRVDRDPAVAHLAFAQRIVGVVTHQGGHVEGHRQAGLALREQELIAAVRLFGGTVTGELTDGPELPTIHGRIDPARVGKLTRVAELVVVTPCGQVFRRVQRFHRHTGDRSGALLRGPLPGSIPGRPLLVRGLAAKRHQLPPCDARSPRTSSASVYGFSFPFRFSRSRRPTTVSPSSSRRASSRARSATKATTSCLTRCCRREVSAPLSLRKAWCARIASQTFAIPSSLAADAITMGGRHACFGPSVMASWISRRVFSAPPRSTLLMTKTSAISRMPALMVWTASPDSGISVSTTLSQIVEISSSDWPTPTVSTRMTSRP